MYLQFLMLICSGLWLDSRCQALSWNKFYSSIFFPLAIGEWLSKESEFIKFIGSTYVLHLLFYFDLCFQFKADALKIKGVKLLDFYIRYVVLI